MLEDKLTDIKIAYNPSYTHGSAVSLTGPAVNEHLTNYSRLGVDKVIIAENDFDTYNSIRSDLRNQSIIPAEVHYKNVTDVVLNTFMSKSIKIVDIDLDFTANPDKCMLEVRKILDYMERLIGVDSMNDRFSIVVTFCQRNAIRGSVMGGYEEIVNTINQSSNYNLQKAYYQGYADGAPMATAMFLVSKVGSAGSRVYRNGFDDIEPLLITKGKRNFYKAA